MKKSKGMHWQTEKNMVNLKVFMYIKPVHAK